MTRSIVVFAACAALAAAGERHYRLKDVDLKQQVIWGAECEGPNGTALAFGGQDQEADDGHPHTRIRVDGQWKAIHEELRAANPLQKLRDQVWAVRNQIRLSGLSCGCPQGGRQAEEPFYLPQHRHGKDLRRNTPVPALDRQLLAPTDNHNPWGLPTKNPEAAQMV